MGVFQAPPAHGYAAVSGSVAMYYSDRHGLGPLPATYKSGLLRASSVFAMS